MKNEKRKSAWSKITVEQMIMLILGIAVLGWLIWTIVQTIWFPDLGQKTVTFNVTGVTGPLNASSLVSVHFDCIKYCSAHVANQYMDDCWNQCSKLGNEVCK